MTTNANLKALTEAGVSIWLDDLSRQRISSGNLAQLITDQAVVGVTSNPTIFANALSNAADYADKVKDLAARGASVDDTIRELTTADVRDAADIRHAATAEGILCLTAMETALQSAAQQGQWMMSQLAGL